MVGHLYKDFKLSGIPLVLMGMMGVFLILLPIAVKMENPMQYKLLLAWALIVFNGMSPVLSMCAVAEADEKEKWVPYALSLPGGVQEYVRSKYVFVMTIMLMGAMFTNAYTAIHDGICNEVFLMNLNHFIILIGSGSGMLFCAFYFPFIFRFGTEKGGVVGTGVILLVIAMLYIYLMFGNLSLFESDDLVGEIMNWLEVHIAFVYFILSFLFLFSITLMYGSYRLLVHWFKKEVIIHE